MTRGTPKHRDRGWRGPSLLEDRSSGRLCLCHRPHLYWAGVPNHETKGRLVEPIRIIMELEKETKNTVRYTEKAEGKPPAIGTLYIQKWATSPDTPKAIRVTVEAAG